MLEFSQLSLSLRQLWEYTRYNSFWNPGLLELERTYKVTHEPKKATEQLMNLAISFLSNITIIATNFVGELKTINPGCSHNFFFFLYFGQVDDFKQMYIYPR